MRQQREACLCNQYCFGSFHCSCKMLYHPRFLLRDSRRIAGEDQNMLTRGSLLSRGKVTHVWWGTWLLAFARVPIFFLLDQPRGSSSSTTVSHGAFGLLVKAHMVHSLAPEYGVMVKECTSTASGGGCKQPIFPPLSIRSCLIAESSPWLSVLAETSDTLQLQVHGVARMERMKSVVQNCYGLLFTWHRHLGGLEPKKACLLYC